MEKDRRWVQEGVSADDLVKMWGMTKREADERKVDNKKAMLALILRDEQDAGPVGVLYLDSTKQDLFGEQQRGQAPDEFNDEQVHFNEMLRAEYKARLAESLTELVESALRKSPQLSLEHS